LISEFDFPLFSLPIGFASTMLLTYLLMRIGLRTGVLDIPNERSSHSSPVPRGGGVSIIIAFSIFLYVYPMIVDEPFGDSIWKGLLFGGLIVATVGFIDDLNHIPARWRFLAHLSAAFLVLTLLQSLPKIIVFELSLDFGYVGYIFFAIALVWYVNLFNFMDGIDGIAGIEAITVLSGAALILFIQEQIFWPAIFAYLACCVGGFLVWNWPPARVFMGDACSGFLGFTLGLLAIFTSIEGSINLWSWLILCGVFIVDATTTLIRRMIRGQNWYAAHKSHAYQILSRRFASHRKVSVGVMFINLFWLFPLGLLAAFFPYWGLVICCIALIPLLILVVRVGAGTRERQILSQV
jgi:Fuc2NAc and GlcNAc transferase